VRKRERRLAQLEPTVLDGRLALLEQPAGDPREIGPRVIAPLADSFRGVSVTATNSDDVAAIGVSAGFAGTAAVNLSGAVEVVNVDTTAHIGKSAQINCGASCNANVAGADPEQSVRVAAGNQYHQLSIAATIAVAGTVGVGVGVGVHLVTLKTDAYVDDGAGQGLGHRGCRGRERR
jgi:hypothetical protein